MLRTVTHFAFKLALRNVHNTKFATLFNECCVVNRVVAVPKASLAVLK